MPVDFSKIPKTLSVESTQFGSMFPFHPPENPRTPKIFCLQGV